MDSQKSMKTAYESIKTNRWLLCLSGLGLTVCFWLLYILTPKVDATRCKFTDDLVQCMPHASHVEWHRLDRMSKMGFAIRSKFVSVDMNDVMPLDLHTFEKIAIVRNPSLTILFIRASKLTYIPNLEYNSQLIQFNASCNEIVRLEAFEFSGTSLQTVDLTFNKIAYIHEDAFNVRHQNGQYSSAALVLRRIYLQNNRLTRVKPEWFQNVPQLSILDLRNNLIAAIGAHFLTNVNYLNIDSFVVMENVIKRKDELIVKTTPNKLSAVN